jgi:murein DD-endopeptidase MepM/ murein hydrolase activator NlpD
MAGKVAKVGVHPSYGRYVIMSHDSGYQTWYAHLSRATAKMGSSVAQGEMLGEMGNTGYSTGPHLHFSIFKNGSPVDPMRFIR